MVKKFLIFSTIFLASIFSISKVNALTIDDFILPSGVNIDDYYVMITERTNNRYTLFYKKKTEITRFLYTEYGGYGACVGLHYPNLCSTPHSIFFYQVDNVNNTFINANNLNFNYINSSDFNTDFSSISSSSNWIFSSVNSLIYSNFILYNNAPGSVENTNVLDDYIYYNPNVSTIPEPDFEFTYTPNTVNDYITSVSLLITLNFVDDENYNYYYKFGEVVDWRQLYSENFVNNTFSQLIKRNGIFYFKITDKENNVVVAKTFSINNIHFPTKPSIEYDADYITEYDTITSVNLLTDFYVYDDQNYICQQKFVDSSQNFNDVDFITYNCDGGTFDNITSNGSVYSRILLNNNIVYSSTYTIYNIGSLSPSVDLNFFDRIGKSLNYGGPISNMITTPVQILNTIYSAVQFQTCEPVSLGILFGHELTLPCIDVEGILGHNLYMFIDLVCAFYVSINIIGFILDTYNKLMDLHPDSLDSQKGRGGIFK